MRHDRKELRQKLIRYMVEDNAVPASHAEIVAARCLRMIEANTHLCKVLDDDFVNQNPDWGSIILAAYIGEKIENHNELDSPSCQELREIVYRLYDQETAETKR